MKEIKISIENLSLRYSGKPALKKISMNIVAQRVTAFIGPSGCGKSTFLRTLNRMNDLIENVSISGKVLVDGIDIYDKDIDVVNLRKRIGMVFQRSNLFPKSVFDNLVFGVRLNGIKNEEQLMEIAERTSKQAAIWDEIRDRLEENALNLSMGQQQRLCIARALAVEPDIILMDEPASALDPISTGKIEDLIYELKKEFTILIVTHNMQQAARVSDSTAFLYQGELIEYDRTSKIFTNPSSKQTEDYITGRFG